MYVYTLVQCSCFSINTKNASGIFRIVGEQKNARPGRFVRCTGCMRTYI